jgi:hypothetical protein
VKELYRLIKRSAIAEIVGIFSREGLSRNTPSATEGIMSRDIVNQTCRETGRRLEHEGNHAEVSLILFV